MLLKDRVKWYGVLTAGVFLAISIYMQVKYIFHDADLARFLEKTALVAAFLTLVFGVMALPRWQSFFALAVAAYAAYWFTQPPFGIP